VASLTLGTRRALRARLSRLTCLRIDARVAVAGCGAATLRIALTPVAAVSSAVTLALAMLKSAVRSAALGPGTL
jgi:hypothetical protein